MVPCVVPPDPPAVPRPPLPPAPPSRLTCAEENPVGVVKSMRAGDAGGLKVQTICPFGCVTQCGSSARATVGVSTTASIEVAATAPVTVTARAGLHHDARRARRTERPCLCGRDIDGMAGSPRCDDD